mmetsp:Transcript_130262/g.353485  ORF Transcript_130262/g.353485 Transcript_130262/m.353485 type:complete len:211 (+) Transcript_130262:438-1070(+)
MSTTRRQTVPGSSWSPGLPVVAALVRPRSAAWTPRSHRFTRALAPTPSQCRTSDAKRCHPRASARSAAVQPQASLLPRSAPKARRHSACSQQCASSKPHSLSRRPARRSSGSGPSSFRPIKAAASATQALYSGTVGNAGWATNASGVTCEPRPTASTAAPARRSAASTPGEQAWLSARNSGGSPVSRQSTMARAGSSATAHSTSATLLAL